MVDSKTIMQLTYLSLQLIVSLTAHRNYQDLMFNVCCQRLTVPTINPSQRRLSALLSLLLFCVVDQLMHNLYCIWFCIFLQFHYLCV